MPAYLKIENIGVCPPEGFTVLGVSLADTSNKKGVIGQFGSGNKHGVAVCLRSNTSPVVFCGKLRLDFFTKPHTVSDDKASKDFERVCVRYGGVDETGKNRSSTEDLGFVMDYGQKDWEHIHLALREFVSNAIDRSIRECGDWSKVKVEIVEENQVRAKKGHTRVFLPLNPSVLQFYNDLGKWFLHFSEPELLGKTILPKRNRSLNGTDGAVVYRRGVLVRQFHNDAKASLFDYNLDDLNIDESRKASDWDVHYYCGRALANAEKDVLHVFFHNMLHSNKRFWEFTFNDYSLRRESGETGDEQSRRWTEAFDESLGRHAVLTDESQVDRIRHKGYTPVVASTEMMISARGFGIKTHEDILSENELAGREISDAKPAAQMAVDFVWDTILRMELSNNKEKPPVKQFVSILDACTKLNGYYDKGVVYINSCLVPEGDVECNQLPEQLLHVALEEIVHYVTGSTDNSRDFQDYLLTLAVKLSR